MRTLSFVSKFLMWALLMVYSVFQVLAVFGIMGSNADIIKAGQGGRTVSPIPLIAATILMLAAVILFAALAKRKYIGLIVSVVASAVMLMVALELGRQLVGQRDRHGRPDHMEAGLAISGLRGLAVHAGRVARRQAA